MDEGSNPSRIFLHPFTGTPLPRSSFSLPCLQRADGGQHGMITIGLNVQTCLIHGAGASRRRCSCPFTFAYAPWDVIDVSNIQATVGVWSSLWAPTPQNSTAQPGLYRPGAWPCSSKWYSAHPRPSACCQIIDSAAFKGHSTV